MVIVNFSIVMGAEAMSGDSDGAGFLDLIANSLHGRAAALFVVLAGVGLGLMGRKTLDAGFYVTQYKRAAFLLIIGLLNMLIFDADILHYYALYFAIGVWCLSLRSAALVGCIIALSALFVGLVLTLNYDAGWDWGTYSYSGFWTPSGFVRNLLFNGWHPVIPWLGFLLWGIILSRLNLRRHKTLIWLFISHGFFFGFATLLSQGLMASIAPLDAEAALLFGTAPVPPMPLYIMAGGGAAGMAIALCLAITPTLKRLGILPWLTRPGRQTLTLYVAHIYLGMGMLDVLGMLGGQSIEQVMLASLLFCLACILYAWAWNAYFKRGPLEALMRKLTG